jgi:hypothetical protein
LACFALVALFSSCVGQWDDTTKFRFVNEIVEKGDGQCTYYFGDTVDDKTRKFEMNASCGLWKLREGIVTTETPTGR